MMGHQEVRCNHFPLDLAVASVDHGPCTWERKDLACREPSHAQQGVIRACCCRATIHPRPRCAPSSRRIKLLQTICRTLLTRRNRRTEEGRTGKKEVSQGTKRWTTK